MSGRHIRDNIVNFSHFARLVSLKHELPFDFINHANYSISNETINPRLVIQSVRFLSTHVKLPQHLTYLNIFNPKKNLIDTYNGQRHTVVLESWQINHGEGLHLEAFPGAGRDNFYRKSFDSHEAALAEATAIYVDSEREAQRQMDWKKLMDSRESPGQQGSR